MRQFWMRFRMTRGWFEAESLSRAQCLFSRGKPGWGSVSAEASMNCIWGSHCSLDQHMVMGEALLKGKVLAFSLLGASLISKSSDSPSAVLNWMWKVLWAGVTLRLLFLQQSNLLGLKHGLCPYILLLDLPNGVGAGILTQGKWCWSRS